MSYSYFIKTPNQNDLHCNYHFYMMNRPAKKFSQLTAKSGGIHDILIKEIYRVLNGKTNCSDAFKMQYFIFKYVSFYQNAMATFNKNLTVYRIFSGNVRYR